MTGICKLLSIGLILSILGVLYVSLIIVPALFLFFVGLLYELAMTPEEGE